MIWLSWRQSRLALGTIWAAMAAIALTLMLTHARLTEVYRADPGAFLAALSHLQNGLFTLASLALLFLPVVLGVFWGAPLLARELEGGTHRLVWTQSVTRIRWLTAKLGLAVAAGALGAGALSLALTWWADPIDRAVSAGQNGSGIFTLARLTRIVFDTRGVVPVAYAVFAVVVGAAVGAVLRRSIPAMGLTLVLVVVVQVVLAMWVRPQLIPPVRHTVAITAQNLDGLMRPGPANGGGKWQLTVNLHQPDAWVLGQRTVDGSGATVEPPQWVNECMGRPGTQRSGSDQQVQSCFARLDHLGYRQQVTYQPADRFWTIQWRETGLLAGLALLLTAFTFWRLRRLA